MSFQFRKNGPGKEDGSGNMFLIAGLGNPGRKYEKTRHNMGFDTIDCLVEKHGIRQSGVKFNAMYGRGVLGGHKVILMKPLSYMNCSGGPVRDMAAYFKIDIEKNLIVISDDVDLEPGQMRIRKQGSAGGHNGLKDIIEKTGTSNFIRVRIGVGARPRERDLADHVLSRFSESERKIVDECICRAGDAVEMIISRGAEAAMNEYNQKRQM